MKAVMIGAGNLATHLAWALQAAKVEIVQVYSRTEASAARLAERLHCDRTTEISQLRPDADYYIFSLKDNALEDVIGQMSPNGGIWIHTAGSMPMSVFAGKNPRYGVFYPLQTFSKERAVAFRPIPVFVEGSDPAVEQDLLALGRLLSDQVRPLGSDKRRVLHLAAVFACNFTNHMYALAGDLLEKEAIPWQVLLPLIDETAAKVHALSPAEAQTGPAVRYDENVIRKHLSGLSDPDQRQLYQLLSQSIHKKATT